MHRQEDLNSYKIVSLLNKLTEEEISEVVGNKLSKGKRFKLLMCVTPSTKTDTVIWWVWS